MNESTEEFSGGFAAVVRTERDLSVREAGAFAIVAGGNASLDQAGSGLCVVGGDLTMAEAGAGNMLVGGSAQVSGTAIAQLVTAEASVTDSRVGLLIGGKVSLERSEVMFNTAQAAAFGAVAGGVFFLLSRLVRRR
jgi:hypothetical protein